MSFWDTPTEIPTVDPGAGPVVTATTPTVGALDRFAAGWKSNRIRTDAWSYFANLENQVELEVRDRLSPDGYKRISARASRSKYGVTYTRSVLFAAAAKEAASDPEAWLGVPTDIEAFQAEAQKRRDDAWGEAQDELGIDGGGFAGFMGEMGSAMTDAPNLLLMTLGGPAGSALKFILTEATLNALAEGAVVQREKQVAKEMGLPEPNATARIAMGAAFGAGFAGALSAGARAFRYGKMRAEKRTAGRPDGVSGVDYDADVRATEQDLAEGKAPETDGAAAQEAQGGPTPGQPVPPEGFDYSPSGNASPKNNRIGYVFGRLLQGGLPPHVAAGLVGNLMQESGVSINLRAVGDNGNAFGMAQWNGPRRLALIDFARRKGRDVNNIDTQIDFLLREGKTTERAAWDKIMDAPDAASAARIASNEFWRPGVPQISNRINYARAVLAQYENGAVPKWRGAVHNPVREGAAPDYAGYTARGYTTTGQVTAGDGTRIDVDYEVVDASLLRPADGQFQPRDRSRAQSDEQIAEIAAKLDPARLLPSPEADRGAPIVGPDNMIESGNGRVAAITRAAEKHPDRFAAYKVGIEKAGYQIPDGVETPVLIARRKTPLDDGARAQFVRDANVPTVARMSATERAQVNARGLTDDTLALHRPDQPLSAKGNKAFVRRVLGSLPQSERNALSAPDGSLNAEGVRTLKEALFARAYDAPDLLARFAETEAGDLRSLMDALEAAAPAWASLRAEIAAGRVRPEMDITDFVLDAMRLIAAARETAAAERGQVARVLENMLAEPDLLDGALAPLSVAMVRKFWRKKKPARATDISDFMIRYANEAKKVGSTEPGLLAGEVGPLDVLKAIDPGTFGDLSETGLARASARATRAPVNTDLPGPEFRDGAASPEAEQADEIAFEDLSSNYVAATAQDLEQDPEILARLGEMEAVPRTDLRPDYDTPAFWASREYTGDGKKLVGKPAAIDYLYGKARGLAWTDEGLDPPTSIKSERRAVILIGAPGAGKSTVANPYARQMGAAIIDGDEAKKIIPEFGDGVGVNAVHRESMNLTSDVLDLAIDNGDNIVLPKVGGSAAKIEALIKGLGQDGYSVDLVLIDLPATETLARVTGRFRATGRLIPPGIVSAGIDGAPKTYEIIKAKGLANGTAKIDNAAPIGDPRTIVEDPSGIVPANIGRNGADRSGGNGENVRASRQGEKGAGRTVEDPSGIVPADIGRDGANRSGGDGQNVRGAQSGNDTTDLNAGELAQLDAQMAEFRAEELKNTDGVIYTVGDILDDIRDDVSLNDLVQSCNPKGGA